jgi:hypothetical protein
MAMPTHQPPQSLPPPFLYFDNLPAWRAKQAPTSVGPAAPTFVHQSRLKTGRTLWPYPSRGLLGVVLLLGLCVALASWNAKPAPGRAPQHLGFDLRTEGPPPKFNNTSAEPPTLPALPPEKDAPKADLPPVVALEPPAPPQEPGALIPVVFCGAGSLVDSCFRDLHQGDTPMLRNWNVMKLSSLMAVALAANSVPAAPQAEQGQDDLKTLRESIVALSAKLDAMNSNLDKALTGVKLDIKLLNEVSDETKLKVAAMQLGLKALETQLANLRTEMDKPARTSLYPGEKPSTNEIVSRLTKIEEALARMAEGRIANAAPANFGRIQLANRYPEEMLFLVNGKTYKVAPYTTVLLDNQPPGMFTYEVISGSYGMISGANGVPGPSRPMLEPGKTYTITVR